MSCLLIGLQSSCSISPTAGGTLLFILTASDMKTEFEQSATHIHFEPRYGEVLELRVAPGHVSVDLPPVLVPLDAAEV